MTTPTTIAKAQRLIESGRVRGRRGLYTVEGDTNFYVVEITGITESGIDGTCNCKAGENGIVCSHLLAAAAFDLDGTDAHEGTVSEVADATLEVEPGDDPFADLGLSKSDWLRS